MKKIVFASMMALASLSLIAAPGLRAQDNSGTIQIKDPAEFNAYQMASTQSDPKAKAAALESFLTTYPQSIVKNAVLDQLVDAYQQANDPEHTLSAASRLLQVDPNNMKADVISVFIKKGQCAKSVNPATGLSNDSQTCEDLAALATKGLQVPKPAALSDDDWKKQTAIAYPAFHSSLALAAAVKKDFKTAEDEYKAELMLYTDDQSKTAGLSDTLLLAQAFAQPGAAQNLELASWYYARVWDYAPANFKPKIEAELDRAYKKYHGGLDGLDALKQKAQVSIFPPTDFKLDKAKSPAEQIHDLIAATPDLNTLALADKETVLAFGSKEDADKLWALLKDKATQVPGIVIEATATQIKVAVTQDAREAHTADFIVNLKKPLDDKDIPAVGFEFKTQPGAELDGTYDTYTQIPATDTAAASAQIVLRDGAVIPEVKKKATPVHKPSAAHRQ